MAYRKLELTLISAKDIKDVNMLSKMDVYAVATLSGDPRTKQRTRTDVDGGRNPSWNAVLHFSVPADASAPGANGVIHVVLRAEKTLGDRDIGEVHVPLKDVLAGSDDGPKPVQFLSYPVRSIGSGKQYGVLNLSYKLGERIAPSSAHSKPEAGGYPTPANVPTPAPYPTSGAANSAYPPAALPSQYPPAASSSPYPPPPLEKKGSTPAPYPPSATAHSAYPPAAPQSQYPPPSEKQGGTPVLAYPPHSGPQPVTAYPVPAAGPNTAVPYMAPPAAYGYQHYGQPGPYAYPAQPPQGSWYPAPAPNGYALPQQAVPQKKKNKFGMGLGAGLLGGALGGLLIGEAMDDFADNAYEAGYDAGFDDSGGFDF